MVEFKPWRISTLAPKADNIPLDWSLDHWITATKRSYKLFFEGGDEKETILVSLNGL